MTPHTLGINYPLVLEIRSENPTASNSEIGRRLGLTRERVRQILGKEGIKTARKPRAGIFCKSCGKSLHDARAKGPLCLSCIVRSSIVTLTCAYCSKAFPRTRRSIKPGKKRGQINFYCSRRCWGKVAGKLYGFGKKVNVA